MYATNKKDIFRPASERVEKTHNVIRMSLMGRYSVHRLKLLFFCLLFAINAALPSAGLATVYYVDVDNPNANDSNPGTDEALPWRTIDKACNSAQAGDTVLVKAGVYNESLRPVNSGTSGSMITFKAYPGDNVVIDGQGAATTGVELPNGRQYIRIEGFEIRNWGWGNIYSSTVENIEIVNNDVHDSGTNSVGIFFWSGRDILIENNYVHNNGGSGITAGMTGSPAINVTIRGNRLHDNADDGMKALIEQSIIENNVMGPGGYYTPAHSDGIQIEHMTDTIIRNNIIYDYTQMIYVSMYEAVGVFENVEIYGNVFYNNEYYLNAGSATAPGIFLMPGVASSGPHYVNNISIHSNTFLWLGLPAIWIIERPGIPITNINIRNNIFFDSDITVWDIVDPAEINSDYNLFFDSPDPGTATPWINEGSHSIIGEDPLLVDYERFVSWDVHLQPTSPAIDAGDPALASVFNLPTPFLDIDNNNRPQDGDGNSSIVFDIGAYEYVSGNQAPIADAGDDQTLTDDNRNGSEQSTLDGSDSTDPDGTIVSWVWTDDLGNTIPDGETATATLSVGTHTITLRVTDDDGATDTDTVSIIVNPGNQAPTTDAGLDQTLTDNNGNGNESVTLDGSGSIDPDGNIVSWVWTDDLGDTIPDGEITTATLSVGTHTITLTVTDDDGATNNDTVTIIVNQAPTADAGSDQTVTDDNGNGSESVTLDGSGSTDSDGNIVSWVWTDDLGDIIPDGETTTATLSVGTHTITLTVTDDDGATDTDTLIITVNNMVDTTAPSVTNLKPPAGSIQAPLNTLIILDITDSGDGVDADSVTIKVNNNTVYSGDTAKYSSAYGDCYRTGTNANYRFIYQSEQSFDFDQPISVDVNATDLAGNSMDTFSYSFTTEMRSFGENKKVGSDNLNKSRPVTVRDSSGNIWVAWHAGMTGNKDIYINKLTVGSEAFGNSIKLTDSTADQRNPTIAVGNDDKLYVAWQDNRRGNWDIYISTSNDGTNWSAETRVTDSNDNQINPAIVVNSSNNAYIVWEDDRNGNDNQDIYVATSNNDFVTKTIAQITSDSSNQAEPAIAADSANTIYIVWTDTRNSKNDIYGAASNNGPWTNIPIVNTGDSQSSPAIAAEAVGSILHLVWVDDRPGDDDIYYAQTDGGLLGSPLTGSSIIDDPDEDQLNPVVAVTGSTGNNLQVFACWQDERNADDDLYLVEISSGSGTNVFVGDDNTNSGQDDPAIGIDGDGHPYLVWTDSRNTNTDIYYAGSTFAESTVLASNNISTSSTVTVGTPLNAINSVDDVSVVVPAGAYPCDIEITISKITNPLAFAMQCLGAYDFGPSGIDFSQSVTVTIPYNYTGSEDVALAYWYNSLTDALSQQGITDVETIEVSSSLHALRFKTTHFTPFYVFLVSAGGAAASGGGGGGGCSMSPDSQASVVELILPYIGLTVAMVVLKMRDRRKRKALNITKSEC